MNMRNLIAKMLIYASKNFNTADFETLVGIKADAVKMLADEIVEGVGTVEAMLAEYKCNEKFGILMGVKSCYSSFLTRSNIIQVLEITNEEYDALDGLLHW